MMAVFGAPIDAVTAGVAAQRALLAEPWPDNVRDPRPDGDQHRRRGGARRRLLRASRQSDGPDHVGRSRQPDPAVGRRPPRSSTGASPTARRLRDLGEHRLKDLGRPARLFQLGHPGPAGRIPAPVDPRPSAEQPPDRDVGVRRPRRRARGDPRTPRRRQRPPAHADRARRDRQDAPRDPGRRGPGRPIHRRRLLRRPHHRDRQRRRARAHGHGGRHRRHGRADRRSTRSGAGSAGSRSCSSSTTSSRSPSPRRRSSSSSPSAPASRSS